ncbi:MAG TPA: alpha/beta fold hydrolase [Candidatus Acidoferrum sp.]|nr:alpha/beta fold hydrolase [Candidatus Acidoferrum sp.]
MKEEAVLFGEEKSLVGVLTNPDKEIGDSRSVGAILLNPGILHRVGPGRMNVKIARALAALGLTVLRFDFSGIGDSKIRRDNLPFDKSAVDETQSAMNLLESGRGIRRFILLGGCSGARVSFATACCDRRVAGVILMNFPADAEDDENLSPDLNRSRDSYYFMHSALFNPGSWRKLFTGRANYRRIGGAIAFRLRRRIGRGRESSPEWDRFRGNLQLVAGWGLRPVFVCSQGDIRLSDLREAGGETLKKLCSQRKADLVIIRHADHNFSSLFDQERLIKITCDKVGKILQDTAKEGAPPSTN